MSKVLKILDSLQERRIQERRIQQRQVDFKIDGGDKHSIVVRAHSYPHASRIIQRMHHGRSIDVLSTRKT